ILCEPLSFLSLRIHRALRGSHVSFRRLGGSQRVPMIPRKEHSAPSALFPQTRPPEKVGVRIVRIDTAFSPNKYAVAVLTIRHSPCSLRTECRRRDQRPATSPALPRCPSARARQPRTPVCAPSQRADRDGRSRTFST